MYEKIFPKNCICQIFYLPLQRQFKKTVNDMKEIIKKVTHPIVILVVLCGLVGFAMYRVYSLKKEVAYVGVDCPICGNSEVLDFGYNENMDANRAYCSDCDIEFMVSK